MIAAQQMRVGAHDQGATLRHGETRRCTNARTSERSDKCAAQDGAPAISVEPKLRGQVFAWQIASPADLCFRALDRCQVVRSACRAARMPVMVSSRDPGQATSGPLPAPSRAYGVVTHRPVHSRIDKSAMDAAGFRCLDVSDGEEALRMRSMHERGIHAAADDDQRYAEGPAPLVLHTGRRAAFRLRWR